MVHSVAFTMVSFSISLLSVAFCVTCCFCLAVVHSVEFNGGFLFFFIPFRFDRSLGGLEIDLRLRDHLAKKFNEAGKTKKDVFENPRAMAKLFKEANRVKKVLSANVDHFAQVE